VDGGRWAKPNSSQEKPKLKESKMSKLAQSFRDTEVYQEAFFRLTARAATVGRLLGSTINNYAPFCSH
jgi:hypothetical protein